jgi:MFS family permease
MNLSQNLKLKLLLYLSALALFMQMFDGAVLNTALPEIAKYFGESPFEMQFSVISYLLSVVLFLPLSAYCCDRFGTKKSFAAAITVFTLGSFFCAVSNSLFQLSLSRILQGMGGAFLAPVGRLAVLKAFHRSQYPRVLVLLFCPH